MIRPKPISRGNYRYQRKPKPASSLRYDVIMDGAVRVYPDSRQVCQDNVAGRREYTKRVAEMVQRQNFKCCLCKETLTLSQATFEHLDLRGLGGATREDRIQDEDGNWLNGASHFECNSEKGSRR